MRELLLKNLISGDKRRKEVFLAESYENEGSQEKLERRCIYIVKDVIQITDNFDLGAYLNQKIDEGLFHPKQTYITKTHDSKKSQDKFTYKIFGDLYAILDNKLYIIRLMQYLKLEFAHHEQ